MTTPDIAEFEAASPRTVTLVNKPNKDLLALTRDIDSPPAATWDAEWARMLTATPDWSP